MFDTISSVLLSTIIIIFFATVTYNFMALHGHARSCHGKSPVPNLLHFCFPNFSCILFLCCLVGFKQVFSRV